jgi:hypothetical protein
MSLHEIVGECSLSRPIVIRLKSHYQPIPELLITDIYSVVFPHSDWLSKLQPLLFSGSHDKGHKEAPTLAVGAG